MPKLDITHDEPRSGGGRRARRARVSSSLAEINVVPLIDVMLVLLVIFMVAAPMMTQGFAVQLPESRRAQTLEQQPVNISVPASFRQDGRVYLGDEPIGLDVLAERIRQELDGQTRRNVVLSGDMRNYVWEMDGKVWPEVFAAYAGEKPVESFYEISFGDVVRFNLINRTPMAHPMHLHGHSFRVLVDGADPDHAPLRDTVVAWPNRNVSIELLAQGDRV